MSRVEWILVEAQRKSPHTPNGHHVKTTDPDVVRAHLAAGGNVGRTGRFQLTLDRDDEEARRDLFERLGPLPLHVETWREKHHSYFSPDPTLPGSIRNFNGRVIGDVRRTSNEYTVSPPSKIEGSAYRWLIPPPFENPSI